MFNKKIICLLLLAAGGLSCSCEHKSDSLPVQAITNRLSFSQNPANNWAIGYTSGNSLNTATFELMQYADTSNIVGMWHPATGQSGYYPYIGQNRDTVTRTDISNSWALRPGEIAMEGSNTGQYSMLRFTVPQSGKYRVKVVFEGVHFRISTTDVHVLLNNTRLFDDVIEGYGGDPAYHAITGTHPTATFEDSISLQKGDMLYFAVGYGTNGTFYNDTTGLLITIEMV
jgi:hypothetical protein